MEVKLSLGVGKSLPGLPTYPLINKLTIDQCVCSIYPEQGFKVLIEREWLAFGHKFGERCGLTTDDANQQSPVFLQWLDCVHQLTRQYPCDFQFNDNFLVSKRCWR